MGNGVGIIVDDAIVVVETSSVMVQGTCIAPGGDLKVHEDHRRGGRHGITLVLIACSFDSLRQRRLD